MRIVVIGGTTFIGPHVVRALAAAGHDVIVYHRGQHEAHFPPTVRHIRHPEAGIPVVQFVHDLLAPPPDVVLHMVAMGSRDASAFVRTFTGVARRAVVISSGDVYRAYGFHHLTEPDPPAATRELLTEDSPLRTVLYPYRSLATPNDWAYHYDKVLVEQIVSEEGGPAGRLPAAILRLPAVYGAHDPTRRFRPYLTRMDDGREVILMDRAKAGWRFTHEFVENAAAAVTLAVLDERSAGRTYNVGPIATPTTEEWVRLIGAAAGWSGRIETMEREELPTHLRESVDFAHDVALDSTRIRAELGYREVAPLEEAVRRTVAWDRAVPPAKARDMTADYAAEDAAVAD